MHASGGGILSVPSQVLFVQYPRLLDVGSPGTQTFGSNYVGRPAFQVPGVDFAAGINRTLYPTNASLKDPRSLSISGVSVNKSVANGGSEPSNVGNFLEITGSNVVLDGVDLSQGGGWQVEIGGSGAASNTTISNCYCKQFTTAQTPIFFNTQAVGGTVENCELDGNAGVPALATPAGLVEIIGNGGAFLVQNNYLYDAYSDFIDPGGSTTAFDVSILNNLLVNAGVGTDGLAHPDFIQLQSAAGGTPFSSLNVRRNLCLQTVAPLQGGSQGITLYQHSPGFPILTNPDCSENVFIALFQTVVSPNENVTPFIALAASTIIGTGTIGGNWFDTAGNLGVNGVAGNLIQDDGGGPQSGTVSVNTSTNKSLTGKTLTNIGSGVWRFV